MEETKVKFRLKGHESFIVREGWITKGLFAVRENPNLFRENSGADELGVGTNMAKAIRYWMRCAQLLVEEGKGQVRLSPFGEWLLQRDAYLEDLFSLWLLHIHIARNAEQATSWYLYFGCFGLEHYTRREMEHEMEECLKELTGNQNFSVRSLQDDCEAIIQMYTRRHNAGANPEEKKSSPFSRLGLLKIQDGAYVRIQPPQDQIHPLLILYSMQNMMEEGQGYYQVSIDKLLHAAASPGKLLQLRRMALMQGLEQLERRSYITLNRTAGLDMVYQTRKYTQAELLQDYSGG